MSFDERLTAAVDRVTSDEEEPLEQMAVNQTPKRDAPPSFTRTSGAPIYNYEQDTVHSPATARQAMIDFAPNTHLVSYDVFKDINKQGNDDVVFPLMNLFFSQPGRTDSIVYRTSSDKLSEERLPTRGTNLRGQYDIDTDKIDLIRDPISKRLEVHRDKLKAEDYAFYKGTSIPYFTRIRDTFTAAHEMMHGALERESVSPKFNVRQQHYVTDYIFPNILLKSKDVFIDQFGEEDYKREIVNQIMSLGVHHTLPLLQTPIQRYKELRDEFHNVVPKGEYETYALKDIPVEKLMNRLQKELKVASRKTNFKKYADEILSQIDFEEVKKITGKPESLETRRQAKTKRNSGGFALKK